MTAQLDMLAQPKLGRQNAAVYQAMSIYGHWWTLPALRDFIQRGYGIPISEAGLSARIRDLRKPQYGGHAIERRKNGSLWEYRLTA